MFSKNPSAEKQIIVNFDIFLEKNIDQFLIKEYGLSKCEPYNMEHMYFMNEIFVILKAFNVNLKKYVEKLSTIKLDKKHIIKKLGDHELILVSDYNDFFVNYILSNNRINYFSKIITNKSTWSKNNTLQLLPSPHQCKTTYEEQLVCPSNLCFSNEIKSTKAKILISGSKMDFCILRKFSTEDCAFVLIDSPLYFMVKEMCFGFKIIFWKNLDELPYSTKDLLGFI